MVSITIVVEKCQKTLKINKQVTETGAEGQWFDGDTTLGC